ncbi:MAG: hypothetical protein ACYC8T_14595 [Myxococcaceae bacterium]
MQNETCSTGEHCAPGLQCPRGTCQPPATEGGSCSFIMGCRDELRCSQDVCVPRLGEGERCRREGYGMPELVSCVQCRNEFRCDMVSGICERERAAGNGEPCNLSTDRCGEGQVCRGTWINPDGGTGAMGRCEAKSLGAPCQLTGDCPPGALCEPYADGGVGVCVPAYEGSSCVADDECLPAHYCEQHKTCRPPRPEGEECEESQFNLRCDSRLACVARGTGRVCHRLRDLDESCDPAMLAPCMFPLLCAGSGRCLKIEGELIKAGDGEGCGFSSQCASGRCDQGRCQPACR